MGHGVSSSVRGGGRAVCVMARDLYHEDFNLYHENQILYHKSSISTIKTRLSTTTFSYRFSLTIAFLSIVFHPSVQLQNPHKKRLCGTDHVP